MLIIRLNFGGSEPISALNKYPLMYLNKRFGKYFTHLEEQKQIFDKFQESITSRLLILEQSINNSQPNFVSIIGKI